MSTGINIGKSIKVLDEGSTLTNDVAQIDFTGTGVTATAVGNSVTVNVVGATGVWGISNASGVYTFYSTLTLAMAAAVAGQTIELFADVTETGNVTVTLKAGVTINGNGHAYNVTNAGSFDVFESTVAGTYRIYNLIVNRTNGTGGTILNAKNFVASIHYFDGSIFTTNTAGIYSGSANVVQKFYNGNIIITGTSAGLSGLQDNAFYNFNVRATSTASGTCCSAQNIYNSILDHEGTGNTFTNGNAYNCTIIARGSGYPCLVTNIVSNCSLISFATAGHFVNCFQFNNCQIYSTGGVGSYSESGTIYRNCSIVSTVNIGAVNGIHYNSVITATSNIAVSSNFPIENSVIICDWNNIGGHGFSSGNNATSIKECSIKVANASANCIFASAARIIKYANNLFEGATTPVNANITQGIVNTHDNQGNILI
jgi:hypothetical protein